MQADPFEQSIQQRADIRQLVRADVIELVDRNLVVEMHQAISVAGDLHHESGLVLPEQPKAGRHRGYFFVLGRALAESLRQQVAGEVKESLQSPPQIGLRRRGVARIGKELLERSERQPLDPLLSVAEARAQM